VDGGTAPELGPGLAGFEPDVIVAYDALSPSAWLGTWQSRRLKIPLILVEEGISPATPFLLGILSRMGEILWGRYVRNNAAAVAALDPVARDQALAEGFSVEQVHLIRTGVDLAAFRPGLSSHLVRRHGIHGRILLHVGPLRDGRGLNTLVQAFARTVGQRGDWSLVLAGDGTGRRRLRALVERLGIGGQVYFLGKPREEELPGLMGSSTLYVAPALGAEERGGAVRRALACGLPVLASDLPRLSYLVDDNECGLLAPPGDSQAWETMLTRASFSPMVRRRWAARARELAMERFDWSAVAENFEGLMRTALTRAAEAQQAKAPTSSY
jgi:glycosyltransferase involved in cell wall biosynthesis